jgi:hypothetical protein
MSEQFATAISRASSAGFIGQETIVSDLRSPRRILARARDEVVVGCSNSGQEIEFRFEQGNRVRLSASFFANFADTQTQFSWVTQSGHRELPRKLPRFCAAGSELCRSSANVISD